MSNRDKELDELEAELKAAAAAKNATPYIEKPDQLDVGDGTACWIDQNRMCNPTCRAWDYEVQPAQGPDVCRALRSITDIPEMLGRLIDIGGLIKKKAQDNQRTAASSAPVPDPTGRNIR
jgi:hypothetical protein